MHSKRLEVRTVEPTKSASFCVRVGARVMTGAEHRDEKLDLGHLAGRDRTSIGRV